MVKKQKNEEQEAINREIESAMQKALTYQSKIMGGFYRGIMTSLRVTEEMIRRYAEARGGLKKEFAAAELEIIKEIEHAFVKLQRLRVQHDAWLEAQKVMERLQRGAGRPAAVAPKPASPAGLDAARPPAPKPAAAPKPTAPAPTPPSAAPAPKPHPAAPKPAAPTPKPPPAAPKPVVSIPAPPPKPTPPTEKKQEKPAPPPPPPPPPGIGFTIKTSPKKEEKKEEEK